MVKVADYQATLFRDSEGEASGVGRQGAQPKLSIVALLQTRVAPASYQYPLGLPHFGHPSRSHLRRGRLPESKVVNGAVAMPK